jgi:putative transposase
MLAGWRPASNGRPYSLDLRERVVAAVEKAGLPRRQAAAQFGVGITGFSVSGKRGASRRARWAATTRRRSQASIVLGYCSGPKRDFTLSGLVPELAERGLKVDYRSVCNFVHVEKLRFKKASSPANATVPTLPASGRSGQSIKIGLSLSA